MVSESTRSSRRRPQPSTAGRHSRASRASTTSAVATSGQWFSSSPAPPLPFLARAASTSPVPRRYRLPRRHPPSLPSPPTCASWRPPSSTPTGPAAPPPRPFILLLRRRSTFSRPASSCTCSHLGSSTLSCLSLPATRSRRWPFNLCRRRRRTCSSLGLLSGRICNMFLASVG